MTRGFEQQGGKQSHEIGRFLWNGNTLVGVTEDNNSFESKHYSEVCTKTFEYLGWVLPEEIRLTSKTKKPDAKIYRIKEAKIIMGKSDHLFRLLEGTYWGPKRRVLRKQVDKGEQKRGDKGEQNDALIKQIRRELRSSLSVE
jgi:hypothetical protein